jgi:citrate (Re)-synthase
MRTFSDIVMPNYLRHIFPSFRAPRVSFAEAPLSVRVPRAAWCVDSTLALGLAGLDPLAPEKIVEVFELLDRLNNKSGLLRKAEVRVGCLGEREALETLLEKHHRGFLQVEPVATISPRIEHVELVRGIGLREIGIAVPTSDYLCGKGPRVHRNAVVDQLVQLIDAVLGARAQARLDLLDLTRTDLADFLAPLLEGLVAHYRNRPGARLRIRLCDSLGLGLPFTEAPAQRSVPRLLAFLRDNAALEGEPVEFLAHNDLGLALPNALSALMHGCSGLVGSLFGLGERAGIAPTELMLVHLSGLFGIEAKMEVVVELRAVLEKVGLRLDNRHPLFGESALTQSLSPHTDAYAELFDLPAPFDPTLLGRSAAVEVRACSGPAGIIHLLLQAFPEGRHFDGGEEGVRAIHASVVEAGQDRVTFESIEPLVRRHYPDLFSTEKDAPPRER